MKQQTSANQTFPTKRLYNCSISESIEKYWNRNLESAYDNWEVKFLPLFFRGRDPLMTCANWAFVLSLLQRPFSYRRGSNHFPKLKLAFLRTGTRKWQAGLEPRSRAWKATFWTYFDRELLMLSSRIFSLHGFDSVEVSRLWKGGFYNLIVIRKEN